MITLRSRLTAGCALALLALTGCSDPAATPQSVPEPQRLQLDLPVRPSLDGTDAGLITGPATFDGAPVAP